MATDTAIKFYSNAYDATGANSALTFSTNHAGAVVFDKTTHSIYVGGNQYGGSNLVDATFSSNVLTITKRTGDPVRLDFSTLATAESVMNAFKQLHDEVDAIENGAGLGSDGTYTANTSTNYLKTVTTLKGADEALDAQIKTVADEVNAIETGAGLESNGAYAADSTTNYLTGATSLKDADKKLDTKVKSIEDSLFDVTDFNYISNGTSTSIRTVTVDNKLKVVIDTTDAVGSENPLTTKTYVNNKVAALDGTATIASKSGNVVTLKAGLTETDGVVANNSDTDIVLADVATTGAAADVSIADSGDKITATNVEGALAELADRITNKNVSVDSNEKILAVTNNVLSTTLSVAIEKQGESGNQKDYIVLKGIGGEEISKVDATTFVKDGMISNAELFSTAESGISLETPYIKISFNTDGPSEPIRFSVKDLVDTYTSGDATALEINGYTITPKTGAVAQNAGTLTTGGQVYTAIAATKGQDIQTITGENATSQGNYINVKVTTTKDADNNYTLSTTSNVTTHAVETAASDADGLATALDVKTYVDGKAAVANKSATIPVNSTTATTLATVGGTAITAQASFTWEEYS